MASNKKKFELDRVPPTMPIDWRAWESSPIIQNMSDAQLGIALKIMLKQWILGSLPHNAYKLSVVLQSRYETVRKFLQTYPKFVVCSEHGCSWDVVGLECSCTADVASVVCQKTKNFYIDVNSGFPLGTTEPNLTYIEPKETRTRVTVLDEEEHSPQISSKKVKELVREEDEEESSNGQKTEKVDGSTLTREFEDYLGRKIKGIGSPSDRDEANRLFDALLRDHAAKEIREVMKYGFTMNDHYGPGMKMSKKRSPCLMFYEEYDSIKIAMEADVDKREILIRRTNALVSGTSGHALKNPELHTGRRADGSDVTEGVTKI